MKIWFFILLVGGLGFSDQATTRQMGPFESREECQKIRLQMLNDGTRLIVKASDCWSIKK